MKKFYTPNEGGDSSRVYMKFMVYHGFGLVNSKL